jgi:hypothetical protein
MLIGEQRKDQVKLAILSVAEVSYKELLAIDLAIATVRELTPLSVPKNCLTTKHKIMPEKRRISPLDFIVIFLLR